MFNRLLGSPLEQELTFALPTGILVTFSPAAVDTGISASLIQTHSILLSVLLSTNRNQLSLGDVYYALTITSHPLIVYLTISSICDLFGMKTGLYEKIESHRRTIRALGILILPLWLALSLTATLSLRAFKGSGCLDDSLKSWSRYYVMYYPVTLVAQGHGGRYIPVIFTSLFSLCLFRSRSQMMADFRACREGKSTLLWRMVLSIPWTFAKCAWCVSVVVGARLAKSNVKSLGAPSTATISGGYTACSYGATTPGRPKSSPTPSLRISTHIRCLTVRYNDLFPVDDRMRIEYPRF